MQAMTRSDKKRGGGAEWEEEEWEEEEEEDVPSLPETGAPNLALGVGWGGVGCGAGCRVRGAGCGVEVVEMVGGCGGGGYAVRPTPTSRHASPRLHPTCSRTYLLTYSDVLAHSQAPLPSRCSPRSTPPSSASPSDL